ncbi:28S ribosomal protein S5, mitochondrial-like [Monodelphis domestica]|uniref:28S ribosomal protein S5, mitochondrial-like n=1 Tax=Monodelphis domestica TaxID=13616 RepID=UPI0000F2C409|nr:28S ribosomal protein S5, mitochondrial-like [Monodelphis domestica]
MTAEEGRKQSVRVLVAVGNGKGAAGFAVGKAPDRVNALRKAKNRAIYYLHYIDGYEDQTTFHAISLTFKKARIKMKQQPRGQGLCPHQAIITICKLIGIKDMHAKVTGLCNLINITRGIFNGLSKRETHQQLVDKKSLHESLPIVVASPQGAIRKEPEPEDEAADTKADWDEVRMSHGMKKSVWVNLK